MFEATIKRLSNHFESCQVQEVASLLTKALRGVGRLGLPPAHYLLCGHRGDTGHGSFGYGVAHYVAAPGGAVATAHIPSSHYPAQEA